MTMTKAQRNGFAAPAAAVAHAWWWRKGIGK